MCLAVPLKIIEVNGKTAVAEAMGVSREIRVDFIPGAEAWGLCHSPRRLCYRASARESGAG